MLYAIVAVLVLIADQAVKYWVTVGIELNAGSIPVIEGVLSLVNIHNSGAAFGLFENARWLFVLIAVVFVAVVVVALWKNVIRAPLGRWSAVLVMSGAIGNCIDRVMQGYVVDMFKLEFVNFAVFNVADIFITCCGILFCVYIIFGTDFKDTDGGVKKVAPAARTAAPVSARPSAKRELYSDASESDDEGVRTYKPAAKTAKPSAPESPFAEWEANSAAQHEPAEPIKVEHTAKPVELPKVERTVKPAEPPKVERTVKPETKTGAEFTLEDILAEYADK